MTTIYFVRHCESTGNHEKRMQGRTDCDITEHGKLQLELLSKRMAEIELDAIYSSPLQRAHKTAMAIRGERPIEIVLNADLQEMSFGSWENKAWDELYSSYPNDVEMWYKDPYSVRFEGGETFGDVETRVVAAILEIVGENPGKKIAIASHGTPIRLFARYVLNADKSLADVEWAKNTSVTTIEMDEDGKMTLLGYSNVDHLPDELIKPVIEPQKDK